jgi:hypothetical protein
MKREIVRPAEGESAQVNIAGITAMLKDWRDELARSRPTLIVAVATAP